MTTPTPQYRKKPVIVSAIQWTGDNATDLAVFTGNRFAALDPEDATDDPDATAQVLDSLHSTWVLVQTGDWIIRGVKGEYYPCRDTVFRETYEPTDRPGSGDHARDQAEIIGDLDRAEKWTAAAGIPTTDPEVRAWLDNLGVLVPVGIRTLMHQIQRAIISAGDAGYRAGHQEVTSARLVALPPIDSILDAIQVHAEAVARRHLADIADWRSITHDLSDQVRTLHAQVDAVRALHTDSPAGVCPSCGRIGDIGPDDDGLVDWPCATIRAITPTDRIHAYPVARRKADDGRPVRTRGVRP